MYGWAGGQGSGHFENKSSTSLYCNNPLKSKNENSYPFFLYPKKSNSSRKFQIVYYFDCRIELDDDSEEDDEEGSDIVDTAGGIGGVPAGEDEFLSAIPLPILPVAPPPLPPAQIDAVRIPLPLRQPVVVTRYSRCTSFFDSQLSQRTFDSLWLLLRSLLNCPLVR